MLWQAECTAFFCLVLLHSHGSTGPMAFQCLVIIKLLFNIVAATLSCCNRYLSVVETITSCIFTLFYSADFFCVRNIIIIIIIGNLGTFSQGDVFPPSVAFSSATIHRFFSTWILLKLLWHVSQISNMFYQLLIRHIKKKRCCVRCETPYPHVKVQFKWFIAENLCTEIFSTNGWHLFRVR